MKLEFELKKTYHLTLNEDEMRGLMNIFCNIAECDLPKYDICEEVAVSLGKLYEKWFDTLN